LRLGLPISLIIALAIGFISFLNYYNYRKTYQQLNVARIMVVARDLRQAIESGLNVGLAPRSNTQLAASLAVAKDHIEGVRFAVVIDETAKRLVGIGDAEIVGHRMTYCVAAPGRPRPTEFLTKKGDGCTLVSLELEIVSGNPMRPLIPPSAMGFLSPPPATDE